MKRTDIVFNELHDDIVSAVALREGGWRATVAEYAQTAASLRAELAAQQDITGGLVECARAEGFKAGAEHESALRAQLADAMQATADAKRLAEVAQETATEAIGRETALLNARSKVRAAMRPVRLDIARGLGAALLARAELDRLWIAVAPAIDALPLVEAAKAREAFCALLSAGLEQQDALTRALVSDAFDEPMDEWMNSASWKVAIGAGMVALLGIAMCAGVYVKKKPIATQVPIAP